MAQMSLQVDRAKNFCGYVPIMQKAVSPECNPFVFERQDVNAPAGNRTELSISRPLETLRGVRT